MLIAIRNTECKGVYRQTELNRSWIPKDASIRIFRESQLPKALKWAGVTEAKGITYKEVIKGKKKYNKVKYKKNNLDITSEIIALNSRSIDALESILIEIKDETNEFTKTPFYLSTETYKEQINNIADTSMVEDTILMCENAMDYLNDIVDTMRILKEKVTTKLKEFEDYQSYCDWKSSQEGMEHSKEITNKIIEAVENREYKTKILSFIKEYKKNKKLYNKEIKKKELGQ